VTGRAWWRAAVLRTAWLLLGAAIGLAAALLASGLAAVLDPAVPGPTGVLIAACLAPFLLLGLLPGVRELEVTAARAMLGVTGELIVPSHPAAGHRWRSVVWVVLHLALGLVVAVALVGFVPGGAVIAVAGVTGEPTTIAGVGVPALGTAGLAVLGVGLTLVSGVVAVGAGAVAARLAPSFLGPTAGDRLELAEARLAAEAEHVRLARDLHDGIGHALTIITVQAAAGRRALDRDPDTTRRSLVAVEESARRALEELDGMLATLRDPGERPGPGPGVERLPTLVETHREAGLPVAAATGDLPALPTMVSSTVYLVVAEGLANAHRHGDAGEVSVRVAADPDAVRVVVDSPRPSRSRRPTSGGRGLVGVRERVGVLGGTVEAGPYDGRWRLAATIPLSGARRG
jgi:signal transduction histidine kinase